MTIPEQGPARDAFILDAMRAGNYDAQWADIKSVIPGHEAIFHVMADALKIEGTRVNGSARVLQEAADLLGCLMLTPKLADIIWLQRTATLEPAILPITSSTAGMIAQSQKIDAQLAAVGYSGGLVGLVQKTWVIDNDILAHAKGTAENYGFYVIPTSGNLWKGIGTEACVTFPTEPKKGRVIQGRGWAHSLDHVDYSQVIQLVRRDCLVDGVAMDLAAVLQDGALAPLASHQGVLKLLRQPGVDPLPPAGNTSWGLGTLAAATAIGAVTFGPPGALAGLLMGILVQKA